jgi:hypothetical protein
MAKNNFALCCKAIFYPLPHKDAIRMLGGRLRWNRKTLERGAGKEGILAPEEKQKPAKIQSSSFASRTGMGGSKFCGMKWWVIACR